MWNRQFRCNEFRKKSEKQESKSVKDIAYIFTPPVKFSFHAPLHFSKFHIL